MTAELSEENYEYDPIHAALVTFLPIPFCAFFALIVLTAEMNYSSENLIFSFHVLSS